MGRGARLRGRLYSSGQKCESKRSSVKLCIFFYEMERSDALGRESDATFSPTLVPSCQLP